MNARAPRIRTRKLHIEAKEIAIGLFTADIAVKETLGREITLHTPAEQGDFSSDHLLICSNGTVSFDHDSKAILAGDDEVKGLPLFGTVTLYPDSSLTFDMRRWRLDQLIGIDAFMPLYACLPDGLMVAPHVLLQAKMKDGVFRARTSGAGEGLRRIGSKP